MAYTAKVFNVMIASLSGARQRIAIGLKARQKIKDIISEDGAIIRRDAQV